MAFCVPPSLPAQRSSPVIETNELEIQGVTVAGKQVSLRNGGTVNIGAFPKGIFINFGPVTNAAPGPIRLRYRLDGYDHAWHDGGGEMYLAVRFFNNQADQIYQTNFPVHGESTGWNGSLKNSPLTHRRETLVVPSEASTVWIVISSAGPPATVGIYVVADLAVSKSSGGSPFARLIQSPFDRPSIETAGNYTPQGWTRDGNHASMAKIVEYGAAPSTKALAIVDDDPMSHAEWRTTKEFAPGVAPGDRLLVEWNEMHTMGVGDYNVARYATLPPGTYQFNVTGVDIMGNYTDARASLSLLVPQPFWRMLWFWCLAVITITGVSIGAGRYLVWHNMRRVMMRLKNEQALEQERLRIAHDIHDDLGARVTQISLMSAMAQNNTSFPEKARADFDRISQMSRELVAALYETVWAVNPENDHLEALGNYLCQIVKQLCERTPVRCRFHVSDLPREIQVSSQTRHNIIMAVKEAVHNVIKHAKATEIAIHMGLDHDRLTISVQDDGCGFQPADSFAGNGLRNMKRRLESIGGTCSVESNPGKGTAIQMCLVIRKESK